jgi:3-oxoacyl-[acyl-carrier protein] reductase
MAASKGLGRGCAEELARQGYRLVICARNRNGLDETASALRAAGAEVVGVPADVSRAADLEAVFEAADSGFGRLDVLVANAGGPPPGGFLEVSDDQWETAFHLTQMSAVRAMRLAVARMQPAGYGRIIVIGSYSVKQPIEGLVLSNAFRPALLGVVKTLAQEVAARGITVNMVSPGRIETDRVRALDEVRARAEGVPVEQVRLKAAQSIPAGRYGQPQDLAVLVAFLASEAAGYITGQSVLVDGGLVSALP